MTPYKAERKIRLKQVMALSFWEELYEERPSYKKVCRWSKHGLQGIKLESHKEGGWVYTSEDACRRFAEATKEYRR